jgi:glutaredoxin
MTSIVLYTIDCPKCKILESKLNLKNISYEVFKDKDKMIEKGLSTMPVLEVDGQLLDFGKAIKWINEVT